MEARTKLHGITYHGVLHYAVRGTCVLIQILRHGVVQTSLLSRLRLLYTSKVLTVADLTSKGEQAAFFLYVSV